MTNWKAARCEQPIRGGIDRRHLLDAEQTWSWAHVCCARNQIWSAAAIEPASGWMVRGPVAELSCFLKRLSTEDVVNRGPYVGSALGRDPYGTITTCMQHLILRAFSLYRLPQRTRDVTANELFAGHTL